MTDRKGTPEQLKCNKRVLRKKIPGRGDRVIYQKVQVTVTAWNGNNVVVAHTSC